MPVAAAAAAAPAAAAAAAAPAAAAAESGRVRAENAALASTDASLGLGVAKQSVRSRADRVDRETSAHIETLASTRNASR